MEKVKGIFESDGFEIFLITVFSIVFVGAIFFNG